jgi:hypothetical protein
MEWTFSVGESTKRGVNTDGPYELLAVDHGSLSPTREIRFSFSTTMSLFLHRNGFLV